MSIPNAPATGHGLSRESLASCPLRQLNMWLREAVASDMRYPTAMTLATLDADGRLDQRTVLLKHCDQDGLVFFADPASKKIQDLSTFPSVSLHFFWRELDRQVRICGRAEKLNAALTTRYFIHQPDHEKLAKPLAKEELSTRNFLIQQFDMMRSKFYGGADRPTGHWGGYRVVPDHLEFWQGGGPRLRDRFIYQSIGVGKWEIICADG